MSSFDAVRFCRDFNIPFIPPGMSVKVTSGFIGVQCPNPRCKAHNKPDFGGFNMAGGFYTCWSCHGQRMDMVIRWMLNVNKKEAEEIIWNYKGSATFTNTLNGKKKKAGLVSKVEVPGGKLLKKHRRYLEDERGFNPDYLIDKYGLTAVGSRTSSRLEEAYRNRIIIPIIDGRGKVISYQGRDVTGVAKIRYKGCEIEKSALNYKHTLYGLPYAQGTKCAAVEGVIDQWNMGDGFLATFGTATTPYQIRALAQFERIFILFDPEKNAQDAAKKIAVKLASLGREAEVIDIGGDIDHGELPESDVRYIRRELGFV